MYLQKDVSVQMMQPLALCHLKRITLMLQQHDNLTLSYLQVNNQQSIVKDS